MVEYRLFFPAVATALDTGQENAKGGIYIAKPVPTLDQGYKAAKQMSEYLSPHPIWYGVICWSPVTGLQVWGHEDFKKEERFCRERLSPNPALWEHIALTLAAICLDGTTEDELPTQEKETTDVK